MPSRSAHFIAVDGIDGVGKSTQIRTIQELLERRGQRVLTTRDPGSSDVGQRIRELLLESRLTMHRRTEAMLFMASRCEMIETVIRPALQAGTSVVSDRFLLANVVYQSVSDDHSPISAETLWQLGGLANAGLRPDLTLLLDMPATAAMRRLTGPADRMESRGVEYMEAVRQAFLQQLPHASGHTAVIDANQSVERVTAAIQAAVADYLESCGSDSAG